MDIIITEMSLWIVAEVGKVGEPFLPHTPTSTAFTGEI